MYGSERRAQANLRRSIEKPLDDTKTGAFTPFRDEHGREPTYCPCGVRCAGGVTLIRAFVWNLRPWSVMLREKAQAAKTARLKVPMHRSGSDCSIVVMKRGNARGAKGAGYRHCFGSTGNGRNPMFNGRRQPSCDGTSRMTRECQVRICERLGVKFPGPTRHSRRFKREVGMTAS